MRLSKKMSMKEFLFDRAFYRGVLTLGLPIAAQNLLSSSASLIDTVMVGQLGEVPLSAVGMAGGALLATLCIGIITYLLSVVSVYIGKALGDKLTDKAELFGGLVLIAIGLKILIESFL